MTQVTASDARQEFFRLLDAAERGEAVVVERRGVRFRLSLIPQEAQGSASSSPIRVTDPDVLAGEWTWAGDEEGQIQFRPRRPDR